jgi:mRNA-degrading endonuclease RelE of RelBE toxin-antitoxin system
MEIRILYSNAFNKDVLKFSEDLQEEVFEAVEKFKNPNNHKSLKVHKLKGRLEGKYSFSINYAYRIVFEYVDSKTIAFLLTAGDHDIYK